MPKKLTLIPGFKERQNRNLPGLEEKRWQTPLKYARFVGEDNARRVEESRKLFGRKFFRGDCHSHTQHSDGIGTVAETAAMVESHGLDFQYVTDHWGVTQGPECRKHGLWLGQEPPAHLHHLGILGLEEAFEPSNDLVADFKEVKRRGGVPFIPHPTGWWPTRIYTEEQTRALESLPHPFLMEIINGANNLVSAFDYTDQSAVELWDHLLMIGRRVHAMANTDGHAPHVLGTAWNGVFAARCEPKSILRALQQGKSFASEGPLLDLKIDQTGMGAVLKKRSKSSRIKFVVADSRGLLRVRLVADGRVRKTWHPDEKPLLTGEQSLPANVKRYVRVEAISVDGRRGYSNPVYLG